MIKPETVQLKPETEHARAIRACRVGEGVGQAKGGEG